MGERGQRGLDSEMQKKGGREREGGIGGAGFSEKASVCSHRF